MVERSAGGRGVAVRVTIVVVEDNPLHAQRYRENLARDPGLSLVAEFASARDAVASVGALKPDVALVDLGLPDGSGFDVVRHRADVRRWPEQLNPRASRYSHSMVAGGLLETS